MLISRLLAAARAVLAMPDHVRRSLRSLERELRAEAKTAKHNWSRYDSDADLLRGEIAAIREEVQEGLLQCHMEMGRLAMLVDRGRPAQGPGHTLPPPEAHPSSSPQPPLFQDSRSDSDRLSGTATATSGEWLEMAACPACGTTDRTIVCEWNKLILLDTAPDESSTRYDYAVCHGCGILYATRRPVGGRYRFLLDHFEDVLAKDAKNPLLHPYPLTDDDRERYRRLIARSVLVSEHEGGEHLKGVFQDRLENAGHVELLGALLNPNGARVLEVRSRAGSILEGLRRHFGARVSAMPIWESQQLIIREMHGIETSELIDFDRFHIPFEEPFDLILCNHMFNHAVRLDCFLATIRGALRPGGHLYLYNEIDDSEFLAAGQSMIATMNPLHLQATDRAALVRAVGAAGFAPIFVAGRHKRNSCLMQKTEEQSTWRPIGTAALKRRISVYRRARDRAVLRSPERFKDSHPDVWRSTLEQAVASSVARVDQSGQIRLVKEWRATEES